MAGIIREQVVKRITRSSKWAAVRKQHLKENPHCAACNKKKTGMQVHHIKPFRLSPELELNPRNLITLCRAHHCSVGHIGWWMMYNPYITEITKVYREVLEGD